jgi:hypothetical protein
MSQQWCATGSVSPGHTAFSVSSLPQAENNRHMRFKETVNDQHKGVSQLTVSLSNNKAILLRNPSTTVGVAYLKTAADCKTKHSWKKDLYYTNTEHSNLIKPNSIDTMLLAFHSDFFLPYSGSRS